MFRPINTIEERVVIDFAITNAQPREGGGIPRPSETEPGGPKWTPSTQSRGSRVDPLGFCQGVPGPLSPLQPPYGGGLNISLHVHHMCAHGCTQRSRLDDSG